MNRRLGRIYQMMSSELSQRSTTTLDTHGIGTSFAIDSRSYRIEAQELANVLHGGEISKWISPPAELAQKLLIFGLRGYPGSLSIWYGRGFRCSSSTLLIGAVAEGYFSIAQRMVEKIQLPVQAVQDVVYQKMSVLSRDMATLAMNCYLRLTWWGMIVILWRR